MYIHCYVYVHIIGRMVQELKHVMGLRPLKLPLPNPSPPRHTTIMNLAMNPAIVNTAIADPPMLNQAIMHLAIMNQIILNPAVRIPAIPPDIGMCIKIVIIIMLSCAQAWPEPRQSLARASPEPRSQSLAEPRKRVSEPRRASQSLAEPRQSLAGP